MSVVSNIHTITALTKDSRALSGQRLVRMIAKKSKDGTYESANLQGSMCVSVPFVEQNDVVDQIDKLLPHVIGLVQDTQDKMIREIRIASGRNEITQESISVEAVVAWLDANAAGDRFTTEYLQEWFVSEYTELAKEFINRAISGAADSIVDAKVNVLRDMFAGFASGRYSPSIPQCKAMIRFGTFCADSGSIDSRMDQFVQKSTQILEKKESELSADALGF